MPSITAFGMFHTAIALAALAFGLAALVRRREIRLEDFDGRAYVWLTALTAVTGLFIFHHGGFGAPHVLAILTLAALGVGAWVRSRWVRAIAFSTTVFFHFIPGLTETFTRVPRGAPLFDSPEDPALAASIGVVFVVYALLLALQLRKIRRESRELAWSLTPSFTSSTTTSR